MGGLGAVDAGDDRLRPAASVMVSGGDVIGKAHVYGQSFGVVSEQTVVLSLGQRFPVFGGSLLKGTVGGTVMNERTAITGPETKAENNANAGLLLGLALAPQARQGLYVECAWDSHLFLAGFTGILLATGRKQIITLSLGYGF